MGLLGNEINSALLVFVFGCCVLPFYMAHFISGFLVGVMGDAQTHKSNLLIDWRFLQRLWQRRYASALARVVLYFWVALGTGIAGLVLSLLAHAWLS